MGPFLRRVWRSRARRGVARERTYGRGREPCRPPVRARRVRPRSAVTARFAAGGDACCSAPATTRRSWPRPTAGWWPAPTCWSRDATSVATGRPATDVGRKAAAAEPRRHRRDGRGAHRLARRRWRCPRDLDSLGSTWRTGCAAEARGPGPASSVVTSSAATRDGAVTALGDLQGRRPVTRAGARPATCRRHRAARLGRGRSRGALARVPLAPGARRRAPAARAAVPRGTAGRRPRGDRDDRRQRRPGRRSWPPRRRQRRLRSTSIATLLRPARAHRHGAGAQRGPAGSGCSPAATTTPWWRPSRADVDLPMAWSVVGRVDAGEGVLVDGAPWPGPPGWRSF